jgi:hypothetical protein
MPQVFFTSAGGDIGGARRSAVTQYPAPLVSGYHPESTSVPTGLTGAWPVPQAGGFAPQQPLLPLTVTTSNPGAGSFVYIANCTGSLSSAAGPSAASGQLLSTSLMVSALVYDNSTNKLWVWNPVSSAWFGSTANFTSTST